MSKISLAHPTAREVRGLEIYCKHGEEIALSFRRGPYRVPGCNGTATYAVRLVPEERCECPDFECRSEPCNHIYATRTVRAKTRPCDDCGRRFRGRDLYPVPNDHLTFFEGDELCGMCAAGHGIL